MPYSIRFVESDGSGCGPGRQTFHLDSGRLPPGLTLAQDGTLNGTAMQAGSFQFYVEMREPQDDPSKLRREENAEAVHAEDPCTTLDHLQSGYHA